MQLRSYTRREAGVILQLPPPPQDGSGWVTGVGEFGNSSTASGHNYPDRRTVSTTFSLGRRDFFFPVRFTSFHAHASLLTFFIYFFVSLHCCSDARMFKKPLVHMRSTFPIAILNGTCFFPTVQLHVHKREFGSRCRN